MIGAALLYDEPAPIRLGLLALATDDGIHSDLTRLTPHGVQLHTTRVRSYLDRSTTAARLEDIEAATRTLVPHLELAAIAYACTSGNTVLRAEAIADAVQRVHPEADVVCPLEALRGAANHLGATRLCLVTPYDTELTHTLREHIEPLGLHVTSATALDVPDHLLATLRPASLSAAVTEAAAADQDADAIFIACNALRSSSCISELEAITGRPVLTSTQTLLWATMSTRSGQGSPDLRAFGVLGRTATAHDRDRHPSPLAGEPLRP